MGRGAHGAWANANRDARGNLICSRDDSQLSVDVPRRPELCSHRSRQIRPPFVHARHHSDVSFDISGLVSSRLQNSPLGVPDTPFRAKKDILEYPGLFNREM